MLHINLIIFFNYVLNLSIYVLNLSILFSLLILLSI